MKIKILKENNKFQSVIFQGHANSKIVCAAISAILISHLNCILAFDENAIEYKEEKDLVTVNFIKDNNYLSVIIKNLIRMIKEMQEGYPKEILIEENNM